MPVTRVSPALEPGVCHTCGKRLSRKADLPRHMRTHATNKDDLMIPCPYEGCEYKALQRSNLTTHLHTHTGERPNKCCHPGCTYSTSDPGSLTRHRKSVHGYEPKAKKSNPSVETSRKELRQKRRHSPYSTPSPSSSDSSVSSFSTFVDDGLPELQQLLEDPPCPAAEPYPTVAVKYTYPAYDTGLSPRISPCNDSPIYSSLLGCAPSTFVQQEQPSAASCPQKSAVENQEALFAPSYLNNLDSWMPAPLPLHFFNENSIDASCGYQPSNTFQSDFSQFLPIDGQGIGQLLEAPLTPWDVFQPSFSGLAGGFTSSEQLCYATLPASAGLGVDATELLAQMFLAC